MLVKYISGIGNEGVFQPDNLNLYVYAYNNPLAYTDPSGEVAWFIPIIIGFVVGAYVGGSVSSGNHAPWEWSVRDWGSALIGGAIGVCSWRSQCTSLPNTWDNWRLYFSGLLIIFQSWANQR